MKALVSDLISALPEERREPLKRHQKRLDSTIVRSFADSEEQLEAAVEDREGLGVPRSHWAAQTLANAQVVSESSA